MSRSTASRLRSPTLVALGFLCVASAADAQVVDQEQPVIDVAAGVVYILGGPSNQQLAQVFTAGRSGLLTAADFPVDCGNLSEGMITMELRDVQGGMPGDTVLSSATFDSVAFPGYWPNDLPPYLRRLQLTTPVALTAGLQYALTLEFEGAPDAGCTVWVGPEGDSYVGGDGWYRDNSLSDWAGPFDDLPFRTLMHREGDSNGDGTSDILWRNSSGQTLMWLMDGPAVVGGGSLFPAEPNWRIVGNGDHNGDGRADLLWRHTTGAVVVWFMNGTAILGGGAVATVDPAYQIVGTGDYNADGRADILWRHVSGNVIIWLMSGIQVVGGGPVATVDPSWQINSTSDQNGDGRADILWRHIAGDTTIWLMNGTQVIGGGAIANVDPGWRIVGTADYDVDGRADILWRHTSGPLAMWLMNGTQVIGGGGIGNVDPAWQVVGRGNYDAGGRPDILWRHSSGQAVIWFMNGTAGLTGSVIGTMEPSWQIVDPGQPAP